MLFQTPEFAILFLGTVVTFYLLTPRLRLQLLAISSLTFYAASGILNFSILLAAIAVSYILSKRVRQGGDKWPIYVAILMLLGSLAYFKYGGLAYQNVRSLLGGASWVERPSFLATILPLGISFYTFQVVGYLIDLQKGRAEHARSLLEYTVFVSCFSHVSSGPIMRGKDYLPQLRSLQGAHLADIESGGLLILTGLVKKVVLADRIAAHVESRFAADSFTQPEVWVAGALFAFQLYLDFSGYVDIALGLGRILGIRLSENFRTPYLATSASEFWQRWHITLSTWFRDYLYIPLGGNRVGRTREVFNLLIVMALVGLWHGSEWTFVLWGLIHGLYLALQRFVPSAQLQELLPVPRRSKQPLYHMITLFIFFNLVVLAWIPFRAPDLSTTADMYRAVITFEGFSDWLTAAPWVMVIVSLLVMHWLERLVKEQNGFPVRIWAMVPSPARGAAYAIALLTVIAYSGTELTFIYVNF